MRKFALLIAPAAVAACTTSPPQDERLAAQQHLNQLLAGKVAGGPIQCIPDYHTSSPSVITPDALAFQPNPGRIYVSSTAGSGCEGVAGQTYSLVTTSRGPSGLCAGDAVQIRDLHTGVMAGACTLSPFVPYTRQ